MSQTRAPHDESVDAVHSARRDYPRPQPLASSQGRVCRCHRCTPARPRSPSRNWTGKCDSLSPPVDLRSTSMRPDDCQHDDQRKTSYRFFLLISYLRVGVLKDHALPAK